jgi:hypothetical protein
MMEISPKIETSFFEFKLEDSKTAQIYKIPLMQDLDARFMAEFADFDTSNTKQVFKLIEKLLDKYAPGLFDQINAKQLTWIFERWAKASDITLGE